MSISRADASKFTRSTKVIAVADVVESVRLMELDEHAFIGRWQEFVAFVEDLLPAHGGRLHKSLGDGLMLEFSDADSCLRTASAMQAWFGAGEPQAPEDEQVHLRVGAHLAEFVADQYDIYGNDVNLVARIASLAGPGEIVISAALRRRLGPEYEPLLHDLGECHVKHVKDPVHVYRIGSAGRAPVIPTPLPRPQALRPILAVLPFAVQETGPDDALGGEALADDIVAALATSEQVEVISRLVTADMREQRATLHEVRQHTTPHYVLTGRARRRGQELALYVEVAEARHGHISWACSLNGKLRSLGAADGQLLRELVSGVHSAVIAHEVERSRDQALPSLEGFTLLLASVGLMHRLRLPDLARAQQMLEHLSERWPRHPAAHAWLAHLHVLRLQAAVTEAQAVQEARAARDQAARALQGDGGSVLALAMAGRAAVHAAGDRKAARRLYAEALALRPEEPLPLLFQAELLALEGDGSGARKLAARARCAFPLEPMLWLFDGVAAFAAWVAGDAPEARRLAERALPRQMRHLPLHVLLAAALVEQGRQDQAREAVATLLDATPDFDVQVLLAHCPAAPPVRQRLVQALHSAGLPQG